ncbi:heavy-metal-associated domain-containing protein [Streptomyces sp. NPDC059533]|uniref:heavy-metal-associated domain-containing protein n=1 Tax=Streptomyces sp. NPDC059533 TaxID=3346858 RepID=UPI00367C6907
MSTTRMTFAVSGMHCNSCGLLIDDAVEELPGVTTSTTDIRTERTIVECAGPVDPELILNAITEAGYQGCHLD